MTESAARTYPWFVRKDLDGFFGLFVDNLVQLLAILLLCGNLCGMQGEQAIYLTKWILPGAAVSILLGNLFYAWQAHRLAAKTGRDDVTALPYGINTPSMLVYVFFVMAPAYRSAVEGGADAEAAVRTAWAMGLVACLGSGLIEFCGAFIAEWVRQRTPRAALLSTLAGIAVGFISMTFTLQVFQKPLVAMLPLAVVLITYFSGRSFPLQIPGGLIAVLAGTLTAWLLTAVAYVVPGAPEWLTLSAMDPAAVPQAVQATSWHLPGFAGGVILEVLRDPTRWLGMLSVIIPMGLFNVVGSLQNIESAEAAGDPFDTRSSLAVNGLGTVAAALCGSCFPTTIYIGHPGWKGLGARAGYSTLNGLAITLLCLTGTVGIVQALIPIEAGIAIVIWIGIIITAQAFQTTPSAHAPAVAIGLFPAIAAWGTTVMQGAFLASGGKTMQALLESNFAQEVNGFLVHGLLTIERGYIFTCMILAAMSVALIERKFVTAAVWSAIGAVLAATGLTHAYQLNGNFFDYLFSLGGLEAFFPNRTIFTAPPEGSTVYHATPIAIGYLLAALAFNLFGWWQQKESASDETDEPATM